MNPWRTLRFDFSAMASPCSLQIDGCDESIMRQAAAEAIAEVRRIEHKFSRYRPDSILSQINQSAGRKAITVDAETGDLLNFAQQLWLLSDGLFDITSGVLRHAWDFKRAQLPTPDHLHSLLAQVGWQHVLWDGRQVHLTQTGMELDFGGFGKEYATDRAATVLHRHGLTHALVNLGGDLHALGPRGLPELEGMAWPISITPPRQPITATADAADAADAANAALAKLPLGRGGLATSGDYERFFIHQGQRYCHVLNPKTGWPVSHWQSVSVLAANTSTAGALTTIAMLKEAEGCAWLEAQNARYLAVQHDGQRRCCAAF